MKDLEEERKEVLSIQSRRKSKWNQTKEDQDLKEGEEEKEVQKLLLRRKKSPLRKNLEEGEEEAHRKIKKSHLKNNQK